MTVATLPERAPLSVVREPERMAALLDPLRLRILGALADEPDSSTGIAARLGEARQKVNYHVRALEGAGFLELHEERRKGNCIERIVRTTARRWVLDTDALGELGADPDAVGDRFSAAYLIALAARAVRDVGALERGATEAGKRLATVSLQTEVRLGSPADLAAFVDDLAGAVSDVVRRHHDESGSDGRRFRVFLGGYPEPPDEESKGDAP